MLAALHHPVRPFPPSGQAPISILPTVPCSALAGSLCLTFYHSPRRSTTHRDSYKNHICTSLAFRPALPALAPHVSPSHPVNVGSVYSLLVHRRQIPSSPPYPPQLLPDIARPRGPDVGPSFYAERVYASSWPAATPPSPSSGFLIPTHRRANPPGQSYCSSSPEFYGRNLLPNNIATIFGAFFSLWLREVRYIPHQKRYNMKTNRHNQ